MSKATVSLAGVPLAANSTIAWRLQTGVAPYQAVYSVHKTVWEARLKHRQAQPLDLVIRDARGVLTTIRDVFILHEVASDGPKRVAFLVSDRRWRWPYIGAFRAYNHSRKTGDRTIDNKTTPVEARVTVDEYDYRPYSLIDGKKIWTAKDAVIDVLEQIEGQETSGKGKKNYVIESFPTGEGSEGQFTLQNVVVEDSGDAALARVLGHIPGAEVYIDTEGMARIFNAIDVGEARKRLKEIQLATWDGEKVAHIDRKHIRPKQVHIYYEREVECVLEYSDDYRNQTSAGRNHNAPFVDNVIPTVDVETTVTEYDSNIKADVTKTVPPGTYVTMKAWLAAMDADKPIGAAPWTFETIKYFWLSGDLEGKLVGSDLRGADVVDTSNMLSRVRALREHFRQTFRINRRYMERVKNLHAWRVALLDPVTGARAPAAAWSQFCLAPTKKGTAVSSRKNGNASGRWFNGDSLPEEGQRLIDRDPSPLEVNIVDAEQGIFTLSGMDSPYGDYASVFPSNVVGTTGGGGTTSTSAALVPKRNLALQDKEPMGAGMRLHNGTNEVFLSPTLSFKVMLTLIPGAPNNKRQFHREVVSAAEVRNLFPRYEIQDGTGPTLELFVPPGEASARFAWIDDDLAANTIIDLLGLNSDNPDEAGIKDDPETAGDESKKLPGFLLVNEQRELWDHARALAAEALSPFSDSPHGNVATVVPRGGLRLAGNMSGASIQVMAAPSAKVMAVHEFPGKRRPVSRFALMSESARKVVLQIVRFGGER